jgi:TolB-like protein/Tfp pilus assembly protein PilF
VTDAPTEREGEGAWTRLRRRKVVQWGLAYCGGAWALAQALAHLVTTYHWTEQIQQIGTLLLLIGLPIALILAWYHGDRGQQRVTGAELAILSVLLALGGGVIWIYGQRYQPPPAATVAKPSAIPPASKERPSIAVLPFENRSRLDDDVSFVDGIHDDVLTQLSQISALRVISHTSVERFRDTTLPVKDIAQQLGVGSILEGGVQRAGDRVRINVQLIDAATDANLWAESYDRSLSAANIFAIQSEVAKAIAGALRATLTPAEQARSVAVPTQNLVAWESYQLGKQLLARRTSESVARAEGLFEKAIELDPRFALAHVGLAESLQLQIWYGGTPGDVTRAREEQAVARALQLDPRLGEAWTSSADIASQRGQDDRAEEEFRRAIQLSPNYATAHQWYGEHLAGRARYAEATEQLRIAVALDPLAAILRVVLGNTLNAAGRFDEAEASYRKAIDIDPSFAAGYTALGRSRSFRGQQADALPFYERAAELDPGRADNLLGAMASYFDLGDQARAEQLAMQVRKRWPKDATVHAWSCFVLTSRQGRDTAMKCLQAAMALDPRGFDGLALLSSLYLQRGDALTPLGLYRSARPELLANGNVNLVPGTYLSAIQLVPILQKNGEAGRAQVLLDDFERAIQGMARTSLMGYGVADVAIHALRDDRVRALAALRDAKQAGWRGPYWRYYRDFDPTLVSIRADAEFSAVFADIERDMARQRAELAARPNDAPLDLKDVRK